uniref:Uncharacterized protein n=1 Tax=Arundo donax TaxID=35708 RepID=A0A0A9ANF3_ARUDO
MPITEQACDINTTRAREIHELSNSVMN